MKDFYDGIKKLARTPELNKMAARIGEAFAGGFKIAGKALDSFAQMLKGYKPFNDMLDALKEGDWKKAVDSLFLMFRDGWEQIKAYLSGEGQWFADLGRQIGSYIASGIWETMKDAITPESIIKFRETGKLPDNKVKEEDTFWYAVKNAVGIGSNSDSSVWDTVKNTFGMGSNSDSSAAKMLNPNPVRQAIDNSITIGTYMAGPGEDFSDSDAAWQRAQGIMLNPYKQVR
jgi:hypothetical protein